MMSEPKKEPVAESPGEESNPPERRKSPPKVYLPSCGVLCDVFWWARRKDDPPPPPSEK